MNGSRYTVGHGGMKLDLVISRLAYIYMADEKEDE